MDFLQTMAGFLLFCIGIFAGYTKGVKVGRNQGYGQGWEQAHTLQEGLDGYHGGKKGGDK